MAKLKTFFTCSSCEYQTVKWLGCCPECKSWHTFVEHQPAATYQTASTSSTGGKPTTMVRLDQVSNRPQERMISGIQEWDRVVGNGIMPGSLLILTGDPGIGKSTLLLQVSNSLAQQYRVFYFSTEESLTQVKQRAERLSCLNEHLFFSDDASLETILATAQHERPDIVIIDSIQNCYLPGSQTLPGSTSQLRETAFQLMRLAKEKDITVIATGHITKEGVIAGPKTVEHLVDGVFYLQGEERLDIRLLRAVKNRFGTINELGFFHMGSDGLEEMPNINEHLLSDVSHSPGSVLISVMEGSRPLLLELQALTIESKMAIPQRVVTGIDHKQVMLIAAILQKYLHVKLSSNDIFFKVSGGFKVKSLDSDLGIALALLSSYFQQPLPELSIALGEISLTGQIKPINHAKPFIREAEKFGIKQLLVAQSQTVDRTNCTITRFSNVYGLLALFQEQGQ